MIPDPDRVILRHPDGAPMMTARQYDEAVQWALGKARAREQEREAARAAHARADGCAALAYGGFVAALALLTLLLGR